MTTEIAREACLSRQDRAGAPIEPAPAVEVEGAADRALAGLWRGERRASLAVDYALAGSLPDGRWA